MSDPIGPPGDGSGVPYQLQRQIDGLSFAVKNVEHKVDASTKETTASIDALTKVLDERWKSMEQRFDASVKNQQQAIDGLIDTVHRLDTLFTGVSTEQDLSKERAGSLRRDVERTAETLRWVSRTLIASLMSAGIGIIVFLVEK